MDNKTFASMTDEEKAAYLKAKEKQLGRLNDEKNAEEEAPIGWEASDTATHEPTREELDRAGQGAAPRGGFAENRETESLAGQRGTTPTPQKRAAQPESNEGLAAEHHPAAETPPLSEGQPYPRVDEPAARQNVSDKVDDPHPASAAESLGQTGSAAPVGHAMGSGGSAGAGISSGETTSKGSVAQTGAGTQPDQTAATGPGTQPETGTPGQAAGTQPGTIAPDSPQLGALPGLGNDPHPEITGTTAAPADPTGQAQGTLGVTDPDDPQFSTTFQPQTGTAGHYGTFSIDEHGQWHYTLDPTLEATRALKEGEQQPEIFTVTTVDGQRHDITVTVTGTNDAPTLTVAPLTVDEDCKVLVGQLDGKDVDNTNGLIYGTTAVVPGFALAIDGSYQFDPSHSAYQHLAAGEHQVLNIPVTVTDSQGASTEQTLQITVTGTNDTPTLTVTPLAADEDGALLTGQLTGLDTDTTDTLAYGTTAVVPGFTLTPEGAYHFDPSHDAYQHLAAGEQQVLNIPVTVTDSQGATTEQTLQITVTGTNDTPTLTLTPLAADEDGALLTGQLTGLDTDTTDTLAYGTTAVVPGFTLTPEGAYQFDPNHSAYQHLAAGEQQVLNIPVTVTDSQGASTEQTLQITVTGTNDTPTLTVTPLTADEDGAVLTGQLTGLDTDTTDTLAYGTTAVVPGFALAIDGSYQFDPSHSAYQHLAAGEQQVLTIPVTVTDEHGARAEQTLQITVNGTNDTPTLTVAPLAVEEDSALLTGQISAQDADTTDILAYGTSTAVPGFTLHIDGSYTFDPSNTAYQHLASGQQQLLSVDIMVTDQHGAQSKQTLQITVTGTNDTPIVQITPPSTVFEGESVLHGKLSDVDIDTLDTLTYTTYAPVPGFELKSDGTYTFDPTVPEYNKIPFGQQQVINVPVTVTDPQGGSVEHSVQIIVMGTNDSPTIAVTPPRVVSEDDNVITGQLLASDSDTGDKVSFSAGVTVPGFTLNTDGSYTFDPSVAEYQKIPEGQQAVIRIPVNVTDTFGESASQDLQITLTGTNDIPVIAGIDHAVGSVAAATDGKVVINGKLFILDLDQGENGFQTHLFAGQYGVLEIQQDGTWSYHADASQTAFTNLPDQQALTEQFTVRSTDGTEHTIDLEIRGKNTPSIFAGISSALVNEDQTSTITHQLHISDPNAGDAHFVEEDRASAYGHFSISKDGEWHYQVDNTNPDVQGLTSGKTLLDRIIVGGADGTPHVITITIQGKDDQAIISGSHSGTLEEDVLHGSTSLSIDGQLVVSDPDAGQQHFVAMQNIPGSNGLGRFNIDAQGHWVYHADNNQDGIQSLANNQQTTDSFTAMSKDGTQQTITVTIVGTNDKAVIGGATALSTPDDDTSISGSLTITDTDANEAGFNVQSGVKGQFGSFSISADGHWTYTPDERADALAQGRNENEEFKVTTVDGTEQIVTITVTGSNDAPVITTAQGQRAIMAGDVKEDTAAQSQVGGQLEVVDIDNVQGDLTWHIIDNGQGVASGQGTRGTLTLDSDSGQWVYTLNNADPDVQSMGEATRYGEHFTVEVNDGHGGTAQKIIYINVQGTNDAPVMQAQSQSVNEGDTAIRGQLVGSDVDYTDAISFSTTARIAGFTLNSNGHYVFDPTDPAYNDLAAGEPRQLTIPVTVTDGHGGESSQNLVITVTGTNDTPTVTADNAAHAADLGTTSEDTSKTFTEADLLQLVGASDADSGDTLHVTAVTSPHGTFTQDATSGDWTFTPAANYHGDDVQVSLTINDGHTDVTAHGTIDVTSVTDAAHLGLSVAVEQPVISFGGGQSGSVISAQDIPPTPSIHAVAAEFTIIGGANPASDGVLFAFGTNDLQWVLGGGGISAHNPRDLTISFGETGNAFQTGLDLTADHKTHRWSVLWNGDTGTLDILKDGQVAWHQDNVERGYTLNGSGRTSVSIGNDSGSGVSLNGTNIWQGEMLDFSIAKTAVDPTHLATNPLRDAVSSQNLLINLQARGGHIVDTAHQETLHIDGGVSIVQAGVDTDIIPPNPGALLHLNPHISTPDPDDHVSAIRIGGFVAGTVLDDGHNHQHTATGPADQVDISGWTLSGLTAQLPQGDTTNMRIAMSVETTGPDGTHAQTDTSNTLTLDPTAPIPDAIIGGDSTLTTDQGTVGTGDLTVQDPDTAQEHFIAQTDVDGQYGKFSIDEQGHWTYTPDARANVLAEGEPGQDTFTITTADGTSQLVTVNLTGTNDVPEISGALVGRVNEDTKLSASGKLVVTDPDTGDSATLSIVGSSQGAYGEITLDPQSGEWVYTLNNTAAQGLRAGQEVPETFTVRATDSLGTTTDQQITLTIHGTNDTPTVTADNAANAADLGSSDLGQPVHFGESDLLRLVGAADVDSADHLSISTVAIDPTVGSFAKDVTSGDWVFTPAAGASATNAAVQITITDGTTPVTAQAALDVTPPPPLALTGITSDTGTDATDFITADNTLVLSGSGSPGDTIRIMDGPFSSLGSTTVDATGHWSFDYTGTALHDGTHHIMLLGKNPDGTNGSVEQPLVIDTGTPTITIDPVSQDDVFDSTDQGSPMEITGSVTHVDDGNTVTIEIAGKTYTGSVHGDTWSVTIPTADASALQDQNLLVQAHVETTAGTPAQAQHHLIVSASPDTLHSSGQVQEDITVTQAGQVFQLNGAGTVDTPTRLDGNFGSLIVDASGQYHYQLNNNAPEVQTLGQGESVSDHFLIPITLADGSHKLAQVDFDIAGTNDAPTITGGLSAERSVQTTATTHMSTTGQVVINDVDTHDTLSLTINGQQVDLSAGTAKIDTAVGQLAIRPNGNWEYMLDKGGLERDQLNSLLHTGGSQQERFHIVLTDNHGESRVADIVVNITGDAGNPTLRGTLRAAVVEDATLEADGVLNVVDANGVKQTGVTGWAVDASHSGSHGTFTIDAQGHWHYTLNNADPAVQALAGGEQLTDHATINAVDANGQQISRVIDVDITGTNDAPIITGDHVGNTAEDSTASISGKLLISDVDTTDAVSFTAETVRGNYGSLTVDASGHWTYQVDNSLRATQGLNAGQTEPDTIEVTATSTDGSSIKRVITINVTGSEDNPVIAGSHTGAVTEDAATATITGDLTATDADLGDNPTFQTLTDLQGTYGKLSIDATGHWTYSLDNSLPATQALLDGHSQPDTFTVTATTVDGETVTQDITVTVTGTNDAPTVTAHDAANAADLGATSEDTSKTFTEAELLQLVGASDADSGDTLHVTAVNSPHGTFTQDATSGDWTFTPAANYHGDDVQVSLTINDGHTDVTAHGTIDVTSVTDVPTPSVTVTAEQEVMEFAAGSASGVVNTGTVNAGGTMHGITIDMTILGGDQVSSSGGHGATLISYGTSSDYNHMYIWNDVPGKDLTFRVGGREYATGVEMRNDGHDHRYTFSWDGNAGTLDVLVDGQVVKQMTGVGQGATIEDGGKFALGNDQDSFGGGFSANDAFTGKIFNVGIAKTAVDTAQLQTAQVGSLLQGDSDLLTVIHVQNGRFVDQTGNYQYHTVGSVHVSTVEVDTSIAPPNPGALLSIQLSAGAPADTDDHVTAQSLVGLPAGTVISDGHGHSVTITDPTHPVEIQGWTLSSLTAQLPASYTDNILVDASVTTTGPDGQVESANSYAGVVLDPTKPLPQASASGETDITSSEETLSVDIGAPATSINIDPVTQDNILEHSEYKGLVTVTGTVSGNFENGDTVTINVDNISFTGQVDASGVFAVEVPAAALAADNELEASISPAQGGGTFSETLRYGVDIREAGGITVELVDDTGNPTDHLTSNGALNFIGEEVGGRLEFSTDGGQTWEPTFAPQEGHNQFQVRQIDAHGNVSGATDFAFTLDTQVGNLVVNLPDAGTDNQYSPNELSANGTLTAEIQLPSDAVAGDTLTINGTDYTLTSQDIATGVVQHDVTPGQQLAVSFTDQAGNTSTVATSSVSQFASSVSIDSIDNSLEVSVDTRGGHQIHGQNHPGQSDKWQTNAFETTSGDVTIHGSAVGVADGSPITVHLEDRLNPQNSFDLQGTVSGGQWSVTIDHTRVDQVGDHDWQVNASTADLFGTALHATTEIIDTDGLSQTLSENGAAGSLDLLDGADQINVAQVLYSTDGTHFSSQLPAGVSLDADGHTLHVDPNNPAFDHLAPGDEQKVYVRYQLTETVGGTAEQVDQTAVITVTGTDDLVRISGTTSSQLDTATSQSAQGSLAVTDPDSAVPPTDFIVQNNTAGTYGSFSVDINGDWTYTLDPDNPATRALAAGEQQTDTFMVTTSDGLSHDVVVTVTGADDLPEITGTTSAVADNTAGQAQGSLALTDPDDPQFVSTTTFVAQTGVQGQYGSFEVTEQGQWHYILDPTLDATRALKDGEQQPDTFTVTTADGHSHEITVTVTGTNDAPTVTAHADLGTTDEDTSKTFTEADLLRLVGANDPDAGDTLHVSSVSIDPSVGSFTHDSATGAWTFTPAANFDGSHLPVSIEISDGTDTTTAHAAINVTPVADTPSLDISLGSIALSADVPLATQVGVSAGYNFLGSVFVDFEGLYGTPVLFGDPVELAHVQGILAGGTMISLGAAVHDPVHGDGVQLPGAEACRAFVDNDGSGSVKMIFDSDAPAQMHFSVYYIDGAEETVNEFANWGDFTIDRTPASGGPSHDFSASMPEDSVLPLTLTIGDADNSEQLSVTISGVPAGASLNAGTDNHDGSWTLQPSELTGLQFTPAANWNGEIQLGITVTSTDGTSHAETTSNLKISVTPVEDLSTVSGEDHLNVTEGTASPGADLIIQDPDTLAATFINVEHQQGDQGYGEFSMRDGHWTFEPGPKATALPDGAHASDTVTFRTTDGAEHQVVVDITGSDSPSHISGTLTYGMAEGGREFEARDTASGSLTIVDPDTGSVQPTLPDFTHQAGDNGYGYFTMQGGHWTFTPDLAAVVPLKDGEHVQDTFTVHASDGREAVITVSITGANSAPTVSGSVHLPNLGDESPVTITEAQLLSHASDIDLAAGESLSVSGVTVDHGSITHHSVGTWIFTPETGYTGSVQFSYQVEDQHHGITQASADLTVLAPPPALSAELGTLGTVSGMRLQESSTTLLASADGTAQELNPVDMSVVLDGNGVGFIIQGGLDPNLITGLAIDGQPVTGTPTITTGPDYNSNVVVFQNLDPTAFANAHTVTFTVADGAPATLDVKVIIDEYGMGSFEMFPSEYRTYHIDRVDFHPATETAFQVQGAAEDSDIPLVISAIPVDPSHQMSVVVGGLPAGASLSAGHDNGDGTWTLSSAELSDLKLTPPEDWSGTLHLSVVATETDGVNSTQAQTTIDIDVIPVADAPTLSVTPVVGDEDSAIQLDIDLGGHTDASETVTLSIVGVPDGASLSAGHKQPDGSWLVDAGDVSGLSLTPPQDFNGHIDLSVTATSREATGEFARTQTATLTVNVDATNDAPTATLQGISFDEDTTYHFSASDFGFTDIDSGDQLDHVTFTALPNAAQGTLMLNGQALTSGQNIAVSEIPNLAFQPAPDYYGGVTLAYTVSDGTADSEVTHGTLDVRGVRDVSVVSGVDQVDVAVGYFDFSHLDPTVHSGRNPNAFGDLHIQETMNSFMPIYNSRSDNGYGYFVVRDNGHWQFFLGDTHGDMSALDGIPKGETVTDTQTVMTSDGVKHTLTVSILNPTPEQLAALKAGSDEAQDDDVTSDFAFTADPDSVNASDAGDSIAVADAATPNDVDDLSIISSTDKASATEAVAADDSNLAASLDGSASAAVEPSISDSGAGTSDPLGDYMQFAASGTDQGASSTTSDTSAVDDYLSAAGITSDSLASGGDDATPTEVLMDLGTAADEQPDGAPEPAVDETPDDVVPADSSDIDTQQDDPQHHGI